jgi:hypothetical protein
MGNNELNLEKRLTAIETTMKQLIAVVDAPDYSEVINSLVEQLLNVCDDIHTISSASLDLSKSTTKRELKRLEKKTRKYLKSFL